MSSPEQSAAPGGIGTFEKYLSAWVAMAIIAGIGLGQVAPSVVQFLAQLEVANVNLPVAILIWAMVYPMMVSVDFSSIKDVAKEPKGLAITLVVNWLIKPFTMALLGVAFFKYAFAAFITPCRGGQLYRWLDLAGRGSLHRHGVCLVPPDQRRRQLHAGASQRQ